MRKNKALHFPGNLTSEAFDLREGLSIPSVFFLHPSIKIQKQPAEPQTLRLLSVGQEQKASNNVSDENMS